uniref:Uncharacterized protein n=1 Tax=Bactrocera dorsalis TaxID=27457 RepID=A0A034UY12_BACDO
MATASSFQGSGSAIEAVEDWSEVSEELLECVLDDKEAAVAGFVDEIEKVAVAAEVPGIKFEDALVMAVAEHGTVGEEVLEVVDAFKKGVDVAVPPNTGAAVLPLEDA